MGHVSGRRAEEPCRCVFDKFLRSLYPKQNIQWRKNEQDPPDYWLKLNGRRLAVEVTTLMDFIGPERRSRLEVWNQTYRLETSLKTKLQLRSTGECIVWMTQPLPRDNRAFHQTFQLDLTKAIEKVYNKNAECKEDVVDTCGNQLARIAFSPSRKQVLKIVNCPFANFPKSETMRILPQCIEGKANKLLKRSVAKPWILLLWLDSWLIETDNIMEVWNGNAECHGFSVIYVVTTGLKGLALHCDFEETTAR